MDCAVVLRLNTIMAKTQRELAFLRDLYITDDWTRRFTELADKHVDLKRVENLLYLNAGTGSHCFELREKLGDDAAVFASCENEDLLTIARDKAIALRSDVDFSTIRFEDDAFDVVIADASFVSPSELFALIQESARVAKPGGRVGVMIPASGSFGEIFSLLWEVMFNESIGRNGAETEELVTQLPTVANIEKMAHGAGLTRVETRSAAEVFEYDDGAAFAASPLIIDFLMPGWLNGLEENEKEQVIDKLAQLIDDEDGPLSYRFSVKAVLLTGTKL